MSHQVNIHIHHKPVESDEDSLSCGERLINLDPTRTVLQIGRASKSPSKGLLGAIDNAWFDSPVMSRNHAEIIYSPLDNVVQIRDLGSMHGTFLNGEKLGGEAKSLNSNDQIVFGIGVRRGMDLFQPCHFEVNYEVIPWKRPNSYTVPDSSDEEDEEDEGYHFNDTEMSEGASSPNDTSIEMTRSSPATSKTVDAIDLTLNDTPSPRLKPTEPSRIPTNERTEEDEYTPKSPVLDGIVGDSRNGARPNTNPQQEVDHPQKASFKSFRYTFDYDSNDDEDEEMLSTPSESDDSDMENSSELEGFGEFEDLPSDDVNGEDISEDESMSDASEESEVQVLLTETREALEEILSSYPSVDSDSSRASSPAPQATLAQTLSQGGVTNSRTPFDNNVDIPESHIRTQIHTSEEVIAPDEQNNDDEDEVDDDDDRSVGLSEAANEGLQTLYKDGLLKKEPGSNPTHLIGGSYDDFSKSKSNIESYYATYTPTYDASPFGYYNSHINRSSISTRQCGNSPNDYYSLTKPRSPFASYYGREASPSSVTMARLPYPEKYGDQTRETLSVKTLGDKTGKHAFFEAREENKVQFQAPVDDEETQFSPLSMTTRPTRALKTAKPLAKFVQPILPIKYHGNGIDHGFVINDRPVSNLESSQNRPSIHPYYFSSDASSRAVESPVLERHPTRSGLSIDDIIDSSSVGKKRKADEISNDELVKNEVRDWVSGVNDFTKPQAAMVTQEETTGPESSTQTIHHAQKVQSDVQPPTANAVIQQNKLPVLATTTTDPEHRQVKRLKMRKFVEAVGYFALGGAAVGAGLFSALVATAPDFV